MDKQGVWEPDLDRVNGPIVPLTRQLNDDGKKKSNQCWICKDDEGRPKYHESENAYLLVFEKDVIFRCHRGEKENFSLGRVKFEMVRDDYDQEADEADETECESTPQISTAQLNKIRANLTGDKRFVSKHQ